ncbi:MAG: alpha-glucan family phosphorylase [Bacteroidetes bacterium]|nr:MAG: alpha-glucan family phosphorylase [Bacteroidota bacterium]
MTTRDKLDALAANMWWSWHPEAQDLFRRLNPDAFQAADNNPYAALSQPDPDVLADAAFREEVDAVYDAFRAYMETPTRYSDAPKTTYFCMEYGLHESVPLYAGGLGILAGDHAKAASDLGIPFTAIGLFLRDGYFRQHFDPSGWQQSDYPALDPARHPLTLVTHPDGRPVTVSVRVGHEPLQVRAWRIDLGRTAMYLLDTDFEANPPHLREMTCRLYQGGDYTRIQQEIVLGIGGVRLLRALSIETDVYHMNEGHCAFLTFELMRERMAAGASREEAEAWTRERCVFTTHTPVMAGHDRFDPSLFVGQMAGFREEIGLSDGEMLAYGRVNPHDMTEAFTMTVLALKLSRTANGVSKLHGEVARRQWHHLYPDRPVSEVPIGHVTNGVHLPTWTSPLARPFLDAHLPGWQQHRSDPAFWQERLEALSDEDLWAYRTQLRHALIAFARAHVARQTLPQHPQLDPEALTIGFARRFAPYKRATLLFSDRDRAAALFNQPGRPVQILFAGKAHPNNDDGKRLIQRIYEISQDPAFRGKVIFLENYNMEIGRMLVSGSDVWLNNPRRPMEASGTSGQKVPIHGGLNLSILDGWWPEGFNGHNGWAIGHDASAEIRDASVQDPEDAEFLYQTLEHEVIPAFYDRDADGLPRQWIARMRNAMQTLPPAFSAERMLLDYVAHIYQPAAPSTV